MDSYWIGILIMASALCKAYWPIQKLESPFFGPKNFCTARQCRETPTIPVTLYLVVKAASPLYVSVLPKNCVSENIDNVCYTFFDLGAGFFLVYQSVVYKNNTTALYAHIEVDVPGRFGTLVGADPTCTYEEYVLQLGCDSNFVVYRCFLYGECNRDVVTLEPGYDSIYAIADINKFTTSCQETLVEQIQQTVGFNVTGHVALPNKLDNKCVAVFNGANCIGFEKLDERNSIAVDNQEGSTGEFEQELDQILSKLRAGS